MNKAIFLDRDGVLTTEKNPPTDKYNIKINKNFISLLPKLKEMGYLIFCITNQPDISKKIKTVDEIIEINNILWLTFPDIKKFLYCPHNWQEKCACRKPKPGMIYSLALEYDIVLEKSWVIGDSWRDIKAGENARCKTILFNKENNELMYCDPNYCVENIEDIFIIIERNKV
jgi:histidinol-phosphate phosphatase family protein